MGFTHENTGKLAQFVQTQETFEYRIMGKFRLNSQNQTVFFGHILHTVVKIDQYDFEYQAWNFMQIII